jgi:RecQ-mediated genome instability protein 1
MCLSFIWLIAQGMMLIELNKNSPVPVVRELNEGCSSSTAWLLLGRLKTISSQKKTIQTQDIMDTSHTTP